jgi:hypothetical protein
MPGMTLGVVASWRWLYLAAKPSHMEVYVDGLAYPLAPSCGLLLLDEGSRLLVRHSLVLSCRSIWWHLSGIAGPLGLGYLMAGYLCYRALHGVHRFIPGHVLHYGKIIVVPICISLVELLF